MTDDHCHYPGAFDRAAQDLLNADPIPEDAGALLDALLAQVPHEERKILAPRLHEALFVRRSAQGWDGVAVDLDLFD